MKNSLNFKVIHNRIGVYIGEKLIKELSIKDFNKMCDDIEMIKNNNPVLFEEKFNFLTIDKINEHKFRGNINIGDDFSKGLVALNIRPVYFYKKDISYLFFDFIYKMDYSFEDADYGIKGYNISSGDVVSICIENHDGNTIRSGYIPNSYLRGILDEELVCVLKKITSLKMMINGSEIEKSDFWDDKNIIEYDTVFSKLI